MNGGPTMTPAEVAAWESMIREGSLWDYFTAQEPGVVDRYAIELARRARRWQKEQSS